MNDLPSGCAKATLVTFNRPGATIYRQMMVPSDADLVRAVRLGDRDAFAVLVDRHRARAAGLATAMLGDAAEAEDVCQEALYQAYFGIDRLRDPSRFGAWLCGIAINLTKMRLRQRRMTVALEDLDGGRIPRAFRLEDTRPEAAYEVHELRERLRSAIGELPEDMRAAVWLHYVDGLSYREIGALFGIAPGTLRVLAHRARRRLRQALIGEWDRQARREEEAMIEASVQDVLVWMPANREPEPPKGTGHMTYASLPASRCVVLLRERDGNRALPIWIGPFEAEVLTLHLADIPMARPLTYDFVARLLDAVDVKIDRVAVSALKGETFLATVTARAGQRTHEVDARPSDAINLAVRAGAPIFVDPEVMRQQSILAAEAPRELVDLTARHGGTIEEGYAWRSGREIALARKRADPPTAC